MLTNLMKDIVFKLSLFIYITYLLLISRADRKPIIHNTIGLCRFPNISTHSVQEGCSVCDNMAPRDGQYPAETSDCPWKIFVFNKTIRPHHTQPVMIGSVDGQMIFKEYIIVAKPLGPYKSPFLGHFEPQWDADPVCCQADLPNMLVSSRVRRGTPNETVLWTAPLDYLGKYMFLVTFIMSSRKYWFSVPSDVAQVVKDCRNCTHLHPSLRKMYRSRTQLRRRKGQVVS